MSRSKITWSSLYSNASIDVKRTLTSRPRSSFGKSAMPSLKFWRWLAASSALLSDSTFDSSMNSPRRAHSSEKDISGTSGWMLMSPRSSSTLDSPSSGHGPFSFCISTGTSRPL